jgi:hypothetical protein
VKSDELSRAMKRRHPELHSRDGRSINLGRKHDLSCSSFPDCVVLLAFARCVGFGITVIDS